MGKCFECNPQKYCDGGACCKSDGTNPALGIGDYFRLSKELNESMSQIWKKHGSIFLTNMKSDSKNEFLLMLGILHDPCPFLDNNVQCTVYENRPLSCASFPFLESITRSWDDLSEFGCTQDKIISSDQKKYAQEFPIIMKKEGKIESQSSFWDGIEREFTFKDVTEKYIPLAIKTLKNCKQPNNREIKAISGIEKMMRIFSGERKGIHAKEFVNSVASPVLYYLLEDKIAQRLDNIEPSILNQYEESTQIYYDINKKHS